MKHLKKFEDLDYLTMLKNQKELQNQMAAARESEIERSRQSGYLSKLASDSQRYLQIDKTIEERKEITHLVVQALIFSEKNKEGFDNFKNDLKNLLNNYPIDKLPKSGVGVLRGE
jgi:CHAD domain-containing protein